MGETYTRQKKKEKKHLPLEKRWSHQVKERMHSADVTFRIGPGSKTQLGRTRKMQMWRWSDPEKGSGGRFGPAPAQAPPERCDCHLYVHV